MTASGVTEKTITVPPNPLDRVFDPASSSDYADPTRGPYAGHRLWAEIGATDKTQGLWAGTAKGKPELILRGQFAFLVLCPGGEWLVMAKAAESETWAVPSTAVRLNLPTKEEKPVNLPPADTFHPVAWMPAQDRVLLFQEREGGGPDAAGPEEREYSLLDPATGECERVTGEFGPLTDYNNLPLRLQPASEPNLFWATLVHEKPNRPGETDTDLGKYRTTDFVFSPILHLPGVRVESDQIFVDEANATVWLIIGYDVAKVTLPTSGAK